MTQGHVDAVSRLIQTQNVRVFEAWLAEVVHINEIPLLAWASATVAVVKRGQPPIVVVLFGLEPRAWWTLGVRHLLGWWRVRKAVGKEQKGYRVRVRFG